MLGSQSILGSHDVDELPDEATRSIEADLAFWDDPDDRKADEVDGRIGELSGFHEIHGVYAQGVSITTAVLPAGWEGRCVALDGVRPESEAVCIDKHDLVVAKLVAGRPKDDEFATALLAAGLVELRTLRSRATDVPRPPAVITRLVARIERCGRAAGVRSER